MVEAPVKKHPNGILMLLMCAAGKHRQHLTHEAHGIWKVSCRYCKQDLGRWMGPWLDH